MSIIKEDQATQLELMQTKINNGSLANPFTQDDVEKALNIDGSEAEALIEAGIAIKAIDEGMGNYTLDVAKNIQLALKEADLLEDIRNGTDAMPNFSAIELVQNFGFAGDTANDSLVDFGDSLDFIRRVMEATVASVGQYPQPLIDKIAKPLVLLDQIKEMMINEVTN